MYGHHLVMGFKKILTRKYKRYQLQHQSYHSKAHKIAYQLVSWRMNGKIENYTLFYVIVWCQKLQTENVTENFFPNNFDWINLAFEKTWPCNQW